MHESLIDFLKNKYQNWEFISRAPEESAAETDDIIESAPRSEILHESSITIGEQYDTVYFIDGSESRYIVATAELIEPTTSIQRQDSGTYPIAIGQTSVVACRLNLSTSEFRTAECKEQIVIAVPSILDDKECPPFRWPNDYNRKEDVLIVNYNQDDNRTNLFDAAREAIHKIMRRDEDWILKICLSKLTMEQNPLIIIDGKFQSRIPDMSPVLSINKKFDYTRLPYDTRDAIKRIKNNNNPMWSAPRLINGSTSVWYVRLRDKDLYSNNTEPLEMNAGIVECALMGDFSKNRTIINSCSHLLIKRLANPTCYNLDIKRWRTHLYHMYLTEKTCKQKLISKHSLMRLIYGYKQAHRNRKCDSTIAE